MEEECYIEDKAPSRLTKGVERKCVRAGWECEKTEELMNVRERAAKA